MPLAIPSGKTSRVAWPDLMKGFSILWIAFFHFTMAADTGRYPWPIKMSYFLDVFSSSGPASGFATFRALVEAAIMAFIQRGAEGVGIFIVLSGFGLALSLGRSKGPRDPWSKWYRKRLVRLYPMFWAAHLIFLVSPFAYVPDAIDWRFPLSMAGDRFLPIDQMFYYLVPSWWFIGLLIQLYLLFPILYTLLQRMGPAWFVILSAVVTSVARYTIFGLLHADFNYVQGGLFISRLWEFSFGMALGLLFARNQEQTSRSLFSWPVFAAGLVTYLLGKYCYQPNFLYSFSDGLVACGVTVVMANAANLFSRLTIPTAILAKVGVFSYGLYLLHHPYVITFGKKVGPEPTWVILLTAVIVIGTVCVLAMPVEKFVNWLTAKVLDRQPPVKTVPG